MNLKRHSGLWLALLFAGLLALIGGAMSSTPADAQTAVPIATATPVMPGSPGTAETGSRTLTITGTGSASGSPDIAIVELGVELRSQDLSGVVDQVKEAVQAVIDALTAAGIAPDDIQTINFNVRQDMVSPPVPADASAPDGTTQTAEYVVSNMVRIRVRDTSQLSAVIEAGLDAGANRVFGLRFALEDQTELDRQALQNAVTNARARAETLAEALGVSLGAPVDIREGSSVGQPYQESAGLGMGGGGGPVISQGQLTVTVQVTITYALNP